MSDTDNRADAPANNGEAIASAPIQSDAAAQPAPAQPAKRIAESSFEAAHAELPPLSALGHDATVTASESASTAVPGARRDRGRGAPAGKSATGQTAKVAFGVVENPADLTENLSGKHVQGYGDQPQQQHRREERPAPVHTQAPAPVHTEAPAVESAPAPVAKEEGFKQFVPPVSEGTLKADLNPETERKAREDRRQQRDDRPRGDRPQGGEFRGDRQRAEGQGRPPREERPQGGEFRGEQRHDRGHGEQRRDERRDGQRNERRDNNRGEQRARPGRLTIEAPKVPVQEPTSVFGKLIRAFMNKFWGVPTAENVAYSNVSKPMTPHSREWQFGRGGERRDGRPGDNRGGDRNNGGQRRDFRNGNGGQGGGNNPNRDSRHRPHSRGGNHRDQHGRDGNPRG